MPVLTIASAISLIIVSFPSPANLFQLFQPIGGVLARSPAPQRVWHPSRDARPGTPRCRAGDPGLSSAIELPALKKPIVPTHRSRRRKLWVFRFLIGNLRTGVLCQALSTVKACLSSSAFCHFSHSEC